MYNIFWQWRKSGLWKKLNDKLREQVRKQTRKKPTPTAGIIGVKTTEVGGEERAYESGKKIASRKWHIAVDTVGLLLTVVVHGANWQDQDGAHVVFMQFKKSFRKLKVAFGQDSNYPVTMGPHLSTVVEIEPVNVAMPGDIQPKPGHMFATSKVGRGHARGHQPMIQL